MTVVSDVDESYMVMNPAGLLSPSLTAGNAPHEE